MRGHRNAVRTSLLAAVLLSSPLLAVDYVVTRYDDPAPDGCLPTDCSFREAAIDATDNGIVADRIFLSAGRYEITRAPGGDDDATGDIDIHTEIELIGAGATMTVIDGNSLDRVLSVSGVSNTNDCAIRDLAITGGLTNSGAAGLAASACNFEIDRVDIYGNSQVGGEVAGLGVTINSILTLRDSAIHGNVGDGFRMSQTTAFLTNVTLSGNSGYAMYLGQGTTYCNQCTIRGDDSPADFDIFALASATLQLANTALLGANCNALGTHTSFGGNLESPGDSCDLDHASDQVSVPNPGFGALFMSGGPTPTHPVNVGSAAVDNANDAFCTDSDQRGAARPVSNCDVGAFERVGSNPPIPIFADGFLQGDEEAWSSTSP